MSKDELRLAIQRAFAGVVLADGIGLWEAQAIDDYASEAVREEKRRIDEREDWSGIPSDQLSYAESSLSFFDAAGMRFHLPAFLLAEIDDKANGGPLFALTNVWDADRFALLNPDQRRVVREFLSWCLGQERYCFQQDAIRIALADYWPEE